MSCRLTTLTRLDEANAGYLTVAKPELSKIEVSRALRVANATQSTSVGSRDRLGREPGRASQFSWKLGVLSRR